MLVLLPPSEGKFAPRRGARLNLVNLSFPSLTATREQVLSALVDLCSVNPKKALTVLGVSAQQSAEIHRNSRLLTVPTARAGRIYSGVLYEALDLASLPAPAASRATKAIVVSSALFGAVRLNDAIPAYRLSGGLSLPGLGSIAALWRQPLSEAMTLAAGRGLIIDLRSGTYAAMWRPHGDIADRTVAVRVLHERADGSRHVVSHFNKATKGRLVRSWMLDCADPRDAEALAGLCEATGYGAELGPVTKPGRVRQLDIIVDEL